MKIRPLVTLLVIFLILSAVFYLTGRRPDGARVEHEGLLSGFSVDEAEVIRISLAGTSVELQQNNDVWTIVDRWNHPASPQKMEELLTGLEEMKSSGIVSRNPEKQEIFEVTGEKGRKVQVLGAGDRLLADMYLGKPGPAYKNTYVRLADSEQVHQVEGVHWSRLPGDEASWIDSALFDLDIDDVTGITIEKADGAIALEKSEEVWNMTFPEQAGARQDIVNDLLNALLGLQAHDVEGVFSSGDRKIMTPETSVSLKIADGRRINLQAVQTETYMNRVKVSEKPYYYLVPGYKLAPVRKSVEEFKEEEIPVETPLEEAGEAVPAPEVEPSGTSAEKAASQEAPAAPVEAVPAAGETMETAPE